MATYTIEGNHQLRGEVKISGNKNSILSLMAACLLTDDECVLSNVPLISDVAVMADILTKLGASVRGVDSHTLTINCRSVKSYQPDVDQVKRLRASVLLLGPLLARFRKAKLRHPGGCLIGRRAVGTHFDALSELGVSTVADEDNYVSHLTKPTPGRIFLDEASVTATENALMLGSVIPGETIIDDAACEPHVEDLVNFLNLMGAKIDGAGTNRLHLNGVASLRGASYTVSPDYIDAGTFAIAAAVTRGSLKIIGVVPKDLKMISLYLGRMGLEYKFSEDVWEIFPSRLHAPQAKIQTRPWPGFATDLMSPLIVLATQADGTTLCHDWMYETRMFFVDKLVSMGANITICDPHRVLVTGPTLLRGKNLESPDIRAGMALIVAALSARGVSQIAGVEIVERGYEAVADRLKSIGAKIKRL